MTEHAKDPILRYRRRAEQSLYHGHDPRQKDHRGRGRDAGASPEDLGSV